MGAQQAHASMPSPAQVALMTCSMAMCGFVNMSIVKTGAGLVSQREEAHFLQRCRAFAHGCACHLNPKL